MIRNFVKKTIAVNIKGGMRKEWTYYCASNLTNSTHVVIRVGPGPRLWIPAYEGPSANT